MLSGKNIKDLAIKYGMHSTTLSKIVGGKRYKLKSNKVSDRHILSKREISNIKRSYDGKYGRIKKLSIKYNTTRYLILKVINGA